jgi:hypothetical protein
MPLEALRPGEGPLPVRGRCLAACLGRAWQRGETRETVERIQNDVRRVDSSKPMAIPNRPILRLKARGLRIPYRGL